MDSIFSLKLYMSIFPEELYLDILKSLLKPPTDIIFDFEAGKSLFPPKLLPEEAITIVPFSINLSNF